MVKASNQFTITDLYDGKSGVGISKVDIWYYLSTSPTTQTGGKWETTPPPWENNKYMWSKTVTTLTDGSSTSTAPVCITGSTGSTGSSGVSITKVDVEYAKSSNSTTAPTTGWTTTNPGWENGMYIWSRTKVTYSAGNPTYTTPVCITGEKGQTGNTGSTGATGQGIESVTEEYYLSNSKTTQTGGSWTTTPPSWSIGKYIWSRSKIVYKNPTKTEYTTPKCSSEWEAVNEIEIGGRNLILKSEKVILEGTTSSSTPSFNFSNYLRGDFSRLKGKQVIASFDLELTNAIEATTSYGLRVGMEIAVIYTDNTTSYISAWHKPTVGSNYSGRFVGNPFTFTKDVKDIAGGIFIQLKSTMCRCSLPKLEFGNKATDWTPAPEDTEAIINKTVKSVDVEYYLSTSNTSATGGTWQTKAPSWVNGRYMWSRQKVTFVDGTTATRNETCISGATGQTGSPGKGVSSIIEYYAKNTSTTTPPADSAFKTERPAWAQGSYIWTRSKITYTDSSTVWTIPICVTGSKGDTGSQGVPGEKGKDGVQLYTWVKYADSPTTGMSDSPIGKAYIGLAYNKTSITESSSYGDYAWSLVKGEKGDTGLTGQKGADGKQYYTWLKYADSPTSGMSDDPTNKKYIGFAYNKTTATESTVYSDYTWSLIKGDKGDTGNTGQGVESITELYYLANGKTTSDRPTPPTNWVTTPPTWSSGKYIWTCSKIVYKNPSKTAYTTPVCDSSWEAIEDLEIGGRNLLRNSKERELVPKNNGTANDNYNFTTCKAEMLINETYTISSKVEITKGSFDKISVYPYPGGSITQVDIINNSIKCTFKKTSAETTSVLLYAGLAGATRDQGIIFREIKIEKGNKATDWTPAPEDLQEEITVTTNKVSNIETKLDDITATVSKTEIFKNQMTGEITSIKDQMSQIKQTAESVNVEFINKTITENDTVQGVKQDIDAYKTQIKLDETGITIGKSSTQFNSKFTESKLSFRQGENELAYIDKEGLSVPGKAHVGKEMDIGIFGFIQRTGADGKIHLSIMQI